MQKRVLCQVIGLRSIARQLAQEVSDLRLMTADQLAEGGRVLRPDRQCYEVVILSFQGCRYISNVRYP